MQFLSNIISNPWISRQTNKQTFFFLIQDRIPTPTEGETLPAPYPMKLAPADKRDEVPDKQNIRYAENEILYFFIF